MSNEREAAELNQLEAALASLTPRQPKLDRDAVMYHAGRATIRRWQLATTLSMIAAAILAITLLIRPETERIVFVPAPASSQRVVLPEPEAPESAPASDGSSIALYFHLQQEVLDRGLEGLPPMPNSTDPAVPLSTEDLSSRF